MLTAITLRVNGTTHTIDVDPDSPLLWAIRDAIGLTGTKFRCGIAECGACTVLIDGHAVRSCMFPVSSAAGGVITPFEGLASNGRSRITIFHAFDRPESDTAGAAAAA